MKDQINKINSLSDHSLILIHQPIYQESVKLGRIIRNLFKEQSDSIVIPSYLLTLNKVFIFDKNNKLVFSSEILTNKQKHTLERYYNWITSPVEFYNDYPSNSFDELKNILPDLENNSVVLRTSPKNRLVELHQEELYKDKIMCGGIWINPQQNSNLQGVLVYKNLDNNLSLENLSFAKKIVSKKGFNVGYILKSKRSIIYDVPKGFTKKELLEAYRKYSVEISDIVEIDNKKLYFREVGKEILYVYEIKEYNFRLFDVIIFFTIVSFFLFLAVYLAHHTYLLLVLQQGINVRLEYKLIFLFIIGLFLPIFVSEITNRHYLKRLEHTYLSDEYKKLNSILEKIDAGFNLFLAKRASANARKLSNKSFTELDLLLKYFAENFIIFESYLIASDTKLITKTIAPYYLQNYRLSKLPYEKRLRILNRWVYNGWKPIKEDWVFWHPNYIPSMHQKKPEQISDEYSNPLLRALKTVTLDLIDYYNKLNNISIVPVQQDIKRDIGAVVSPSFFEFLRRFRKLLDKFALVEIHMGSTLIYTKILGSKSIGGQAFIFLAQDFPSFQGIYINFVRRKNKRMYHKHVMWNAIFTKGFMNPFFEIYETLPIYEKVRRKFLSSNKTYLNFELNIKGVPHLVSVKEGSYLKHFILISMIKRELLDKKIQIVTQKWKLSILLILIFELIFVLAFINRIVIPLNAMSEGIYKMVNNKIIEYMHFSVVDEIGVLCKEYNKLIDFLKEMEIGSVLQRAYLPQNQIEYNNLVVCGKNKMAQGVGGDYYDYFLLQNGKLAILLADVSGHGISAALATAMAKAAFNIACNYFCEKPSDAMAFLNEFFFEILQKKKMITCWLGYIDKVNDDYYEVSYTNAGQTYPFIVDINNNNIDQITETSLPLGIVRKGLYKTYSYKIHKNQILILYSDCFIEAKDSTGKEIGVARLQDLVIKAIKMNYNNIHSELIELLKDTIYPEVLPDDATTLVIKWKKL